MHAMNRKAVSLLSGGLDSLLATKIIIDQDIEVLGVHFTSPLCNSIKDDAGQRAAMAGAELGIDVFIRDKGDAYLDVIKNPRHGYGKNMNPCIDCRIYMLGLTRKLMLEEDASFIITGEVLGQRPMSQRRETIHQIERESGLEGLILRPLSARFFTPTLPETEGIVEREQLLGISGRSRTAQYELVARYGLTHFSRPGGGCLLTDPIYARKLKGALRRNPDCSMEDVRLLRMGRHFRIDESMLVIGRNQEENEYLESHCRPPYSLLRPRGFKGPSGMIKGEADARTITTAAHIIAFYAKKTTSPVTIEAWNGTTVQHEVEWAPINPEEYSEE
jgi:tRNA U34 2-thiouridine synthase MnmA/TrmU